MVFWIFRIEWMERYIRKKQPAEFINRLMQLIFHQNEAKYLYWNCYHKDFF
jgi:hypothetical protein